MKIFFLQLWPLCLAVLPLLIFLGNKRSLSRWPLAIFLLVLVALTQPYVIHRQRQKFLTVFCVDVSASISASERELLWPSLRALQKELHAREEASQIILFGTQTTCSAIIPENAAPQLASNCQEALELALAIAHQRNLPTRVVLCSDGSQQQYPQSLVDRFRSQKIPLYLSHPPERIKEWRFESLQVPQRIFRGERLPLSLHYTSNFAGPLRLDVQANGEPYFNTNLDVSADSTTVEVFAPPLPPGNYFFHARVTGDSRQENNQAFAATTILERKSVLLVSHTEQHPLRQVLEACEIEVEQRHLFSLDRATEHAVVVFDDAPLDVRQLASCQEYLQKGGSILWLGPQLKAPWAPASFIPNTPDIPEDKREKNSDKIKPDEQKKDPAELQLRSAAIVLLIDRSDSMRDKLSLVQKSALATITRLWSQDMFGVIAFHHEPQWIVPLGRGTNISWTTRRLLNLSASGGTAIYPALEQALEVLQRNPAHIKHVILLSDGYDEDGIFGRGKIERLARQMQENRISVTTIGIGDDFDTQLMHRVAQAGAGKFYTANDYSDIPVMMLSDVDRVLRVLKRERKSLPPLEQEIPLPLKDIPIPTHKPPKIKSKSYPVAATPASRLLEQFSAFPALSQYHSYRPKSGCQIELKVNQEPLLVHWQWQLGKVMLWTTSADAWNTWLDYPRFWRKLIHHLTATASADVAAELEVVQQRGEQFWLQLTATDAFGKPIPDLQIKSLLEFTQTGEFHWLATTHVAKPATPQMIEVELYQGQKTLATLRHSIALRYAPEFDDLTVETKLLEKMAEETSGGKLPQDQDVLLAPVYRQGEYQLDEPLLWLAVLLTLGWAVAGLTVDNRKR